jgi:hypothetical protein
VSVPVLDAVSARRVRIPAHTAQVIECDLSVDIPEFMLELISIFLHGRLASLTYNTTGKRGRLCVLNLTDRSYTIKTVTKVGKPPRRLRFNTPILEYAVCQLRGGEQISARKHPLGTISKERACGG